MPPISTPDAPSPSARQGSVFMKNNDPNSNPKQNTDSPTFMASFVLFTSTVKRENRASPNDQAPILRAGLGGYPVQVSAEPDVDRRPLELV